MVPSIRAQKRPQKFLICKVPITLKRTKFCIKTQQPLFVHVDPALKLPKGKVFFFFSSKAIGN